jgi:cation diffusion facilitator family transporter
MAIIFGVKFWSAPPDKNHPYGHLRIEALITLGIGIVLSFVALGIAYEAIATIRQPHILRTTWIAIIGPAASIILKEFIYQWTVRVGKRVKSSSVVANAWHHRSDALSSIPVLIAVVVASIWPKLAFVDHIGALIVAIFILKVSWNIIHPALEELIDRAASEKERELIRETAMSVEGVKDAHAVRTRKFGANIHADLHVLVDGQITVKEGHDIARIVKQTLIEKIDNIIDIVVHIEPDK